MVRCFDDPSVVVTGHIEDPDQDRATIELELELADLEIVLRSLDKAERSERSGDRDAAAFASVLRRCVTRWMRGFPPGDVSLGPDEERLIRSLGLLTRKPMLYVANIDENELAAGCPHAARLREVVRNADPEAEVVEVCAHLESELLALDPLDRTEFLEAHGLSESGLAGLIRSGFRMLGLQTFFTVGENEVRAWTVAVGARAPRPPDGFTPTSRKASYEPRRFRSTTSSKTGSMKRARELGRSRLEGKDYVVRDGDILLFRAAP